MPRLARPGCTVEYQVEGSGPRAVVLLHNLLCDRRVFAGVAAQLAGAGQRAILVDLRGHGGSGRPTRRFRIADLCQDVLAILDAESVPRAAFVGQSLGGLVALELALAEPQRVDRLAVVCSTARRETFAGRQRSRLLATTLATLGPRPWVAQQALRVLFGRTFRRDSTVEIDAWRERIERLDGRGAAWAASVWGGRRSLLSALPLLRVPSLVVAGQEDVACSVAEGEELARLIPDARFVLLPGGHTMSVERPAELGELLVGFIQPSAT